jgi:protein transport protein SEC24
MSDYSMYHALGMGEQIDPNRSSQPAPPQFQPPVAPHPSGYGAVPPSGQQFYGDQGGQPPTGAPVPPPGHGYGPPQGQGQDYFPGQAPPPSQDATLAAQMGGMSLGADGHQTARRKKKDRHAYHTVEAPRSRSAASPPPARRPPPF